MKGFFMFKIFLTTIVLTIFTFAEAPLLKTGQTTSYDAYGNVVTDGSVKDDGYYQMGKARSYSRSAAGVVTDPATGLEWQDDVDSVQKPWLTQENYYDGNYNDTSGDTAATYCSDLTLDGGGWRLPAIEELETLTDGMFQHIFGNDYWSSTTRANYISDALIVNFGYGFSGYSSKKYSCYVRCVRGGQVNNSVSLPPVIMYILD